MKKLLIIGLFLVFLFGCISNEQESKIDDIEQSVVPETSDALKEISSDEVTIRGLTGDKCGSYTTYNGLSDSEYEKLTSCYDTKYIIPAVRDSDTSICDEIYNPYEYGHCYGLVAWAKQDSSICNSITNIKFERRGGKEDATSVEACLIDYIERSVYEKREPTEISCSIFNKDYIEICEDYKNLIQPVDGIKDIYVKEEKGILESYIILEDSLGNAQIDYGVLTITLTESDKELYTNIINVSREEFYLATLGTGYFEHEEIIYKLPKVNLKEITIESGKYYGSLSPTFNVKFTNDENTFEISDDLYLDEELFTIKPVSECLIITDLEDELIDESNEYWDDKSFVITGKVTNNCDSTKDWVEVVYTLYDENGVEIYSNNKFLNPKTLPKGYTAEFEIKLQYEGSYVDIVSIPDSYIVIADS